MIGNQTDGHIIERILLVRLSGQFTDLVADCFHRINVEYGIHILHDNRKTLKSHTGIDILLGKFSITTLAITLKLGKYVVPYFHKAVTVTADLAVRLTAAVFFLRGHNRSRSTDRMDLRHAPRNCHTLRSWGHGRIL